MHIYTFYMCQFYQCRSFFSNHVKTCRTDRPVCKDINTESILLIKYLVHVLPNLTSYEELMQHTSTVQCQRYMFLMRLMFIALNVIAFRFFITLSISTIYCRNDLFQLKSIDQRSLKVCYINNATTGTCIIQTFYTRKLMP